MNSYDRLRLALRIVSRYARARYLLHRDPLPVVVQRLIPEHAVSSVGRTPMQLRRGVDRLLRLPGRPMRCLPRSLVLLSLLAEEGYEPRLVIGLPKSASSAEAHAWVEIDGTDVGPDPGRDDHLPIVVYPTP